MKVLFLYSEIAGYFLAGVRALVEKYEAEVHIMRWPLNAEAPFKFTQIPGVTFHKRAEYDTSQVVEFSLNLKPDIVYITGWMDKAYFQAARQLRKQKIPVICAMDNQWKGTLKQHLGTFLSPFIFKPRYSHFWVPGEFQYRYARRLGYPEAKIRRGMYTADTAKFMQAHLEYKPLKSKSYPHRFLFVARLVEHKGIRGLIQAFQENQREIQHDWQLRIIGEGPLKGQLPTGKGIEYRDFVQPEFLPKLAQDAGVFILPSEEEPWGVVLHEFAAAGLPLIASKAVGATTAFLKDRVNGFLHEPGNIEQLKDRMRKCIEMGDAELLKMGDASRKLAEGITPEGWADTLVGILRR